MIRTIVVLVALVLAVLFLPLWIQLVMFLCAVWVVPYRFALLIPAVFADALYSATGHFSINTLTMTLVVAVFILIRWLLVTQTRFSSITAGSGKYGVEA